MHLPLRSKPTRRYVAVGVALAFALPACAPEGEDDLPPGSEDASREGDLDSTGGITAALSCNPAAAPVTCSGTRLPDEVFYHYDAATSPCDGRLLKCDTLDSGSDQITLLRVMYRTSVRLSYADGREEDVDVPATGLIAVPRDGQSHRAVLANTHGMTGMIRSPAPGACSPSRQQENRVDVNVMLSMADQVRQKTGVYPAVVVPDFVGLGADAGLRVPDSYRVNVLFSRINPYSRITHPYLSLESEGRATIDLVRTAAEMRHITGVAEHPKWMVAGASQGGHAALATGEVWARGYDQGTTQLRGVIAGAPGGDLDRDGNIDPTIRPVLASAILVGLSLENHQIVPSRFLSDAALLAFNYTVNDKCLTGSNVLPWVVTWQAYLAGQQLYRQGRDPLADPAVREVLAQNSPGRGPTGVPILIGQMTQDPFIDAVRTESTVSSARRQNRTPVVHCVYQGVSGTLDQRAANHTGILPVMTASAPARPLVQCTDRDGGPSIPRVDSAKFIRAYF